MTKKNKDKLGNARVKLHCQVHYRSKKILSTKNCWVQKMLVQKNLGLKKFWVLKKCFTSKIFWVQKKIGPKEFWVHKFSGSESNVESEKNIGLTKMSGQKNI